MSKEKIRVIRISPNKPPIIDEVTSTPTHTYINIKPFGEVHGNEFKGVWLSEEIICCFLDTDLAVSLTEKKMLFRYNITLAEFERNRDVSGQPTYGDLIIMADTGRSLTIEEIDEYIKMFKEDKASKEIKGVNKYDRY